MTNCDKCEVFASMYGNGVLCSEHKKEWYVSECGRFVHHEDDAREYDHENYDYEFLTDSELKAQYPELAKEVDL